jgi:ABC-type sugar transport system ATPase subunit
VRPEQLELDPTLATGMRGHVTSCRFHGHDVVVTVALGTGPDLTVRILGSVTYEVGQTVAISTTSAVSVLASG